MDGSTKPISSLSATAAPTQVYNNLDHASATKLQSMSPGSQQRFQDFFAARPVLSQTLAYVNTPAQPTEDVSQKPASNFTQVPSSILERAVAIAKRHENAMERLQKARDLRSSIRMQSSILAPTTDLPNLKPNTVIPGGKEKYGGNGADPPEQQRYHVKPPNTQFPSTSSNNLSQNMSPEILGRLISISVEEGTPKTEPLTSLTTLRSFESERNRSVDQPLGTHSEKPAPITVLESTSLKGCLPLATNNSEHFEISPSKANRSTSPRPAISSTSNLEPKSVNSSWSGIGTDSSLESSKVSFAAIANRSRELISDSEQLVRASQELLRHHQRNTQMSSEHPLQVQPSLSGASHPEELLVANTTSSEIPNTNLKPSGVPSQINRMHSSTVVPGIPPTELPDAELPNLGRIYNNTQSLQVTTVTSSELMLSSTDPPVSDSSKAAHSALPSRVAISVSSPAITAGESSGLYTVAASQAHVSDLVEEFVVSSYGATRSSAQETSSTERSNVDSLDEFVHPRSDSGKHCSPSNDRHAQENNLPASLRKISSPAYHDCSTSTLQELILNWSLHMCEEDKADTKTYEMEQQKWAVVTSLVDTLTEKKRTLTARDQSLAKSLEEQIQALTRLKKANEMMRQFEYQLQQSELGLLYERNFFVGKCFAVLKYCEDRLQRFDTSTSTDGSRRILQEVREKATRHLALHHQLHPTTANPTG